MYISQDMSYILYKRSKAYGRKTSLSYIHKRSKPSLRAQKPSLFHIHLATLRMRISIFLFPSIDARYSLLLSKQLFQRKSLSFLKVASES